MSEWMKTSESRFCFAEKEQKKERKKKTTEKRMHKNTNEFFVDFLFIFANLHNIHFVCFQVLFVFL